MRTERPGSDTAKTPTRRGLSAVPAPQAKAAGWLAKGPSKNGAKVEYEGRTLPEEESVVEVCQMARLTPRAKRCREGGVVASSATSTAAARIWGQSASPQAVVRWVVLEFGGGSRLPGEEFEGDDGDEEEMLELMIHAFSDRTKEDGRALLLPSS